MANAVAALPARLDWTSDNKAHTQVLASFTPVAIALFRTRASNEGELVRIARDALEDFERSYAEARGSSFWCLFEEQMPDTPRVDF